MRHYFKIISYNENDRNFDCEDRSTGEIVTLDLGYEVFSRGAERRAAIGKIISVSCTVPVVSIAFDTKIEPDPI